MQNNKFDRSQASSHESLSQSCEAKKRKLEDVKQILPNKKCSSRTATSNVYFVSSCKDSFMASNIMVKTG